MAAAAISARSQNLILSDFQPMNTVKISYWCRILNPLSGRQPAKIFYPLFFLIVILLGFLLYSNTFEVTFLFDGIRYIRDNQNLRISQLTLPELWQAAEINMQRPAANISLALNYYIHGYEVPGYHYFNTAIHIAAGIFLFLLLKSIMSLPACGTKTEDAKNIALFATLLWFVHPLATQSVTYIVQRMNSMAAMFYALSLLLYVQGRLRNKKWAGLLCFSGSLLAWLLSIGSKEIAVTLPFFILLVEWYFLQDLSKNWFKKWSPFVFAVATLLFAAAYLYAGKSFFELNEARALEWQFTTGERLLTEFRVVIYYLTLIFLPHPSRLFLDYDYPLSHSLVDPATTIFALVAIIVLFVSAILLAKRQRLISFCMLWYLGNLVLESSIINLEIIYEHRTYLPSMFVWPLVVALALKIGHQKSVVAALCCIIVLFSFWTYQRNGDYADEVVLWTKNAAKFNNKPRIAINLGKALAVKGRLAEAKTQFLRTIRLDPHYPRAHYDLANIYAIEGNTEEAIKHYRLELKNNFDYPKCHYNLAYNLAQTGRYSEAVYHYQQAIRLKSTFAPYHSDLGRALFKVGKKEEAAASFRLALSLQPDFIEALDNLGMTLASLNKLDEAIKVIQHLLELNPADATAHFNLGNLFRRQNRLSEAMHHFQEAVRLKPDFVEARQNIDAIQRD